jgi:ATP/maltotriose-dependent transcriptional regulator MalT
LVTESYPDLIQTGRIETLAQFARHGIECGSISRPLSELVSADLALREGSFERALSLGQSATASFSVDHPLRVRGLLVAGRAAQLAYQFEDAYALYSSAFEEATRVGDRSDAAWGVCLAAIFLEDGRSTTAIAELEALQGLGSKELVRLDTARTYQWLFHRVGRPEFDDHVASLARSLSDPWVRTSWSYLRANAMVLNARYEDAVALLRDTLHDLGEFRLVFATPHVKWTLAAAELGTRRFSHCERLMRAVERHPGHSRDLLSQLNVRALRARLCLAQQDPSRALQLTGEDFGEIPSRAMYGEYVSTRSLAQAVGGEHDRAIDAAESAEAITSAGYVRVLAAATRAVVALASRDSAEKSLDLLQAAASTGLWDGVVCAVRAMPTLLTQLVEYPEHRVELGEVLRRSNDARLAKSVGLAASVAGGLGRLTPREREVMEHVVQGKRSAEIATSLFITVATVKRHLDSAYRKLGAQNRAEAIARYAEMVTAEAGEFVDQ